LNHSSSNKQVVSQVNPPGKIRVLSSSGQVLISAVETAEDFRSRAKGLLGRDSLPDGQALCIVPCNCIHSFGMRFSLDVIFLGRSYEVTRMAWNLAPGRIAFGGLGARMVLEMQSGWFPRGALRKGDSVSFTSGA
jgi:uncharacterized membrane protein (UPF0127 family)